MSRKRHFKGIPVSGGVVSGSVYVLDKKKPSAEPRDIPEEKIEDEVKRFEKALHKSKKQLKQIRRKAEEDIDSHHASIFDSHILMLDDPLIAKETIKGIREDKKNAEYVLEKSVERIASLFSGMTDEYFSSRASDIYDAAHHVLNNLLKIREHPLRTLKEPVIVVAHDLGPSDTVMMDRSMVIGFATDVGGPTSHTAIMAKALEIPAVVGVAGIADIVNTNDQLIEDGLYGNVIREPTEQESRKYKNIQQEIHKQEQDLVAICQLPAETVDGYPLDLSANIEIPDEVEHVKQHGADGVGLFRTEFVYMNREHYPDEDEQFEIYKEVVETMSPKPVIFRTLDIGGDKFLTGGVPFKELNPFLGLRAVRLGLAKPDLFKHQLRAILRTSALGKVKLMFPMISRVEEVLEVKKLLNEVREELKENNMSFSEDMEVGIMVEIPSAAITADILAKEVDFFSIGTNDLIQYTLAVDRVNERVAHLYEPFHPSILRLIRDTINAAHRNNVWVGLCGEMASDPMTAMILLGLGIDELSMGPIAIPEVKRLIRSIRLSDARRIAGEIMEMETAEQIRRHVKAWAKQYL